MIANITESFPTGGKMKINSKKVFKTCALSLSLLLIGGAAFGPLTKTYAEEQGQQPSQEDRIVRIHFNVADKGYKVHIWYDKIDGVTRRFDGKDEFGPYIDIKVEKNKPTLYFIIAVIDENNKWGDKEYKAGDGRRIIDLTNKDISQIWVESGQDGYKLEDPSKPKENNDTDWAEKIKELINKIDDLNISEKEKANLAIKLYEIKDRKGKRTEEDFKAAEKIFNDKAKENPGSGVKETSAAPIVEKITKSSTKIKGRGVPGAKIEIYYGYPNEDLTLLQTGEIKVDKDGNWSVDKPSYIGIHSNEIIIVSQTEKGKKPNQTKAEIEDIKTNEFINRKIPNLKAKDMKVWKGDKIDWVEAYDIQGKASDDEYKFINDELKLAMKRDLNNRTSEKAGEHEGKMEFTFRDGSKLELSNTLYVTKHVVGADTQNVPDDAITVEMKLGEGVKTSDKSHKVGDKYNPVLYQAYKVKPNTDISKYQVEVLNKSIVEAVPLKAKDGYQNPKFKDKNNGEDFVVTSTNNVFTAVAEKIPEKKEKTTIRINYHRPDKKIDGWKVKIWDNKGKEYSQNFKKLDDNGNYYAEVSLDGKLESVSYIIYNEKSQEVEKNGAKDKDGKRSLTIDKNKDKTEASVQAKKKEEKKPEEKPDKKPDKKPQDPATPGYPKTPYIPKEKPDYSDYLLGTRTSEKKAKPSKEIVKTYEKLRKARERNMVSVRAAKLLLEISPNRVKDVKHKLESLIKESELLVIKADIILEKLEAKYEF